MVRVHERCKEMKLVQRLCKLQPSESSRPSFRAVLNELRHEIELVKGEMKLTEFELCPILVQNRLVGVVEHLSADIC